MDYRAILSSRPAAIGLALALALLALGVSSVAGGALRALIDASAVELSTISVLVLGALLQQGVIFGGIAVLYVGLRKRGIGWLGVSRPDLTQAIWIASGWALAFVSAMVIGFAVLLAGLDPGQNRLARVLADNPTALLVMIPVSILVIGPGEELLFRGVIQGSLRDRFGPVLAVGLATVIFAAAHFTSLTGPFDSRVLTVAILTVPALVFGIAYEQTDNLVVPAAIHGLYNATLFGIQYVALSFGSAPPPGAF